MAKVLNPRARRGVVRASVTRLEAKIAGWEEKETLTDKNRQSIVRALKRLQELNAEFKVYHYSIVELMDEEDKKVMAEEQQVLDDHENKIEDLTERLEDMITTTEPVTIPASETSDARPAASSTTEKKPISEKDLLRKRVDRVDKSYRTVKGDFDERGPEMDTFTLQANLEEPIDDLKSELRGICKELISIEDSADLEERADTLERLLRTLKGDVRRLAGNKEENSFSSTSTSVTEMSSVKLPQISIPSFDGNVLNWKNFGSSSTLPSMARRR